MVLRCVGVKRRRKSLTSLFIEDEKMEFTKLKTVAVSSAILLTVLPKALYHVSNVYTKGYLKTYEYIADLSDSALKAVGLTTVKTYEKATIDGLITKYANQHKISESLVRAVMQQESRGNSDSYSIAGAIGLMQIMPENAERCGFKKISHLWDDENNIKCGVQILREEIDFFKGNIHRALQSYNGGTSKVDKSEAVKKYANEVIQRYVQLSADKRLSADA